MLRRFTLLAIAIAVALSALPTSHAIAAEDNYAMWTMAGSGGQYTGTLTIPNGFPAATYTSDSRAPAQLNTGNSTWLAEETPFGAVFGSSRERPYVNLRPAADTPDKPSTTTYVFDSPTPIKDWGFVLGDIDADEVTVTATDTSGAPVSTADLGFAGVFNYCDVTSAPGACSGVTAPYDLPTWTPGINSGTVQGNPRALDTTGASAWFQPTAALSTLGFTYRARTGFPIYQTWFAGLPQPSPTPSPSPSIPAPTESPTVQPVDNVDISAPKLAATGVRALVPTLGLGFALLVAGLGALAISGVGARRGNNGS